MATYRSQLIVVPFPEPQGYAASLRVTERPVYGSSRLGTYARWEELYDHPVVSTPAPDPVQPVDLNYELTDHLGNVTAVVTGRLLNGNGGGTPKQAELVSAQGYEAFGSLLPGRNYNSGSSRYLFQGQEHDDEINGSVGTSYAFEYRMHDPRVGRFLSIDPLAAKYPWNSPYSFAENKVIQFIELEGLETARNRGEFQGQAGVDWGHSGPAAWGANESTNWKGRNDAGREFEIFKCTDCVGPSGRKDSPLMYQYTPPQPAAAQAPLPAGNTGASGSTPAGDGAPPPPANNPNRPVIVVPNANNNNPIARPPVQAGQPVMPGIQVPFVDRTARIVDPAQAGAMLGPLVAYMRNNPTANITLQGSVGVPNSLILGNSPAAWAQPTFDGGTLADLALARASAVRNVLIATGIDPNRMNIGLGTVGGDDPANRVVTPILRR